MRRPTTSRVYSAGPKIVKGNRRRFELSQLYWQSVPRKSGKDAFRSQGAYLGCDLGGCRTDSRQVTHRPKVKNPVQSGESIPYQCWRVIDVTGWSWTSSGSLERVHECSVIRPLWRERSKRLLLVFKYIIRVFYAFKTDVKAIFWKYSKFDKSFKAKCAEM